MPGKLWESRSGGEVLRRVVTSMGCRLHRVRVAELCRKGWSMQGIMAVKMMVDASLEGPHLMTDKGAEV